MTHAQLGTAGRLFTLVTIFRHSWILITVTIVSGCSKSAGYPPLDVVEEFHSKLLRAGVRTSCVVSYVGILSRSGESSGFFNEQVGEWRIWSGTKGQRACFIWLDSMEKSTNTVSIRGHTLFVLANDEELFVENVGLGLGEFLQLVSGVEPVHTQFHNP